MKYIISFTTSPTRINKIKGMLQNLMNQTHKAEMIILNIPRVFKRTNESYDIPTYIQKSVHVNIIDNDYGPATKIVPTILYLKENSYDEENTRIIYLDDDILYPTTMLETVNSYVNNNNNAVYTCTGFDFINLTIKGVRTNRKVCTVAEGYGGVCVKLSMFGDDFEEYISTMNKDQDCYLSDDIILSNYYHKHKNKIIIINERNMYSIFDLWEKGSILGYGNELDALHLGANGTSVNNENRYKQVLKKLKSERYMPLIFIDKSRQFNNNSNTRVL